MGSSPIQVAKNASVAQLVEQGTENPRVGGSTPPQGTIWLNQAGLAQQAEQLICNQQVDGSIPLASSTNKLIWKDSRVAKGSRL